jgi:hypothetical protein
MFLSQANRFCFSLKILGQSKAIWFGLEIVLGKIERFHIIQKLKDRNKMFLFGPLIIGTKAKRFNLFQNYLNWIGTFWRFLKYFKSDRIKYCEYIQLWRLETTTEIDGTAFRLMNATASKSYRRGRVGPLKAVVKLFKIRKIGAKLIFFSLISTPRINDTQSRRLPCLLWKGRSKRKHKRFDIEAYYRNKAKPLIWSAYYRNKSRTFQSVPKLFKIELERFGVF